MRKEESLKILAKKAREEQSGVRPLQLATEGEEAERDRLRADRARFGYTSSSFNECCKLLKFNLLYALAREYFLMAIDLI